MATLPQPQHFCARKLRFRGVVLLLSFLIQWMKHSQIRHEEYLAIEPFMIIDGSKSHIWSRKNSSDATNLECQDFR